jgi:hypothetical protein
MRARLYDSAAVRSAAFVGAGGLAVALIVIAFFNPNVAATGWLVGFVFWMQILVGSLTLTMIHRLTGGCWGEIVAPAVELAALAVPFLLLLAIPLFVAIPVIYPWPHRPVAIKPDVLSYYLNAPSFIVRSVVALVGWSALAVYLPRIGGRSGQLLAALGLVFHALVISCVSIDWYLSLEAPFTSSSFGAGAAISALVAALAWAVFWAPALEDKPAIGDVGGLLLTTILGITYIDFMAVLVIWYGDLPREETWFVVRDQMPWAALAWIAFLLASLLPVLALLLARVRNARHPLRAVGACVLVGLACYDAYLLAPPAGGFALVTALIAILGIGLALTGVFLSGITNVFTAREPADAR